jgi:diaminohydroxyphosphoribosylaminopyrimidine deaminase / 5-amino-6-(5-phosphoribosylamino)uracil reductase
MTLTQTDLLYLEQACTVAAGAVGLSEPNPRVGCVLVSADRQWTAHGHTQQAGGAHAEVMALRQAQNHGFSLKGATAYVSLEPCSHHGRTPPCTQALIHSGVTRVVAAVQDPNPQVAGQGLAQLRAAGLEVHLAPASSAPAQAAHALNIGFFSRFQRGLPWVRLKVAVSADGRTALPNGQSQWITGEAARADAQAFRKRAGAILTGVGTVLADNPRMDVRVPAVDSTGLAHQPLRVIIDSKLQTPLTARILQSPAQVLIYAAQAAPQQRQVFQALGVEVALMPTQDGISVDLHQVLRDLAARGVNELHAEAGARLNAAWVQQRLVDEFLIYMAPQMLGRGMGLADFECEQLADAPRFEWLSCMPIGCDLRLIGRAC